MIILNNFSDVTLTMFILKHDDMKILCNNIDRELIETFLQKIQLHDAIGRLLRFEKKESIKLSKEDIFYLFEKYASQFGHYDMYFFLDRTIDFTLKDIDYILEHSFNLLKKDALSEIFLIFDFDKQTLEKYLEKVVTKYPDIFDDGAFSTTQDFPVEIIIKLYKENKINKKQIENIFNDNKHLSDEDKNKLENLLFT